MASVATPRLPANASTLMNTVRSIPNAVPSAVPRIRANNAVKGAMPPGYDAVRGQLETFVLPDKVTDSLSNRAMAKAMINAWRRDGILQVGMSQAQQRLYEQANAMSRSFFRRKPAEKQACLNDTNVGGYIASGEEITAGIADYSEIFTVIKDLDLSDSRVRDQWPCHGPCPWPDQAMKRDITAYMAELGQNGEKLLQLIELGLDIPPGALTKYTQDGWHHMRILRFPATNKTNGKGKEGRGIGSHTDYGLLVIAAQDDVGGLFIRAPRMGEDFANWNQSVAGLNEDASGWMYVPPEPGVFTVFPGDMMQYMTNSFLPSTPHKVGLNTAERFAFAYFHEPNFKSVMKPLPGYEGKDMPESIHYGTHFTNMALRAYPERSSIKKLNAEGRYAMLNTDELRSEMTVPM